MDNSLNSEKLEEIKAALQNNNQALAAERIQSYLKETENTPLNIGITGESGSGKSTFVNAFRGIESSDEDERAAPTGVVETTMEVKGYPHPNYPNVTLWDLPGIGTTKFPVDKYLHYVEFEKYDFFIIISADRFRQNDVKLAKEIQKMGKKFYFVRSKIDHNVEDEKRCRKRNFSEVETLEKIRNNCIQGLQNEGFESPQVFLVASFDLQLYDFTKLHDTLQAELPKHKRDVLLFALPNISLEIINKKKEAFQNNIKFYALSSAAGAVVPIPGLSFGLDVTLMVKAVNEYVVGFGLDNKSLKDLARVSGVSFEDLKHTIMSPLALEKVNGQLIIKMLQQCTVLTTLLAVEEGLRFIPFFGTVVAAGLSSLATYKALESFLDMLAEDAQRVFEKALRLTTSV